MGKARRKDVKEAEARLKRKEELKKSLFPDIE